MDRQELYQLVAEILPFDHREKKDIERCLQWIESGADLFRIKSPNIPDPHLVSYAVCLDLDKKKILLGEHLKSGLWIPPGGHVDPWEHPRTAAKREFEEELFTPGKLLFEDPCFFTLQKVYSLDGSSHHDYTFWYLFNGKEEHPYSFDKREFASLAWYSYDDVPLNRTDANMERFLQKLEQATVALH